MKILFVFFLRRLKGVNLHFVLSLLVAIAVAAQGFGISYPSPDWNFYGGREMFLLLVLVDVVLGPPLTVPTPTLSASSHSMRSRLWTVRLFSL